jgi:hypothetical protein
MSAKVIYLLSVLFNSSVIANVTLDSIERQIFKDGLHRELQTKIVYTVTDVPYDLEACSFVIRENITKDHYIYYEEVTRDMPGFQTWPHDKPMNIEAPVSTSQD